MISGPLGILLALFKLANKYGEELGERLIQQVLVKPTQVTPNPRQQHRIGEGIAGSAIQTNRPVETRNNLHPVTIGQRTLPPSALFAWANPSRCFYTVMNRPNQRFQLGRRFLKLC